MAIESEHFLILNLKSSSTTKGELRPWSKSTAKFIFNLKFEKKFDLKILNETYFSICRAKVFCDITFIYSVAIEKFVIRRYNNGKWKAELNKNAEKHSEIKNNISLFH